MKITEELVKTLPKHRMMYQIETHSNVNGYYFFNEDTKKSFQSRIHSNVYGGCVFVTSEKNKSWRYEYDRAYTVRIILGNGNIKTVGEFQGFDTRYSAHAYAKALGEQINEKRK